MYPITLCEHRNLLITVAIGSGISFADITLNFHIFCLRFGPPIIPCIPHSGVGRTTHNLMLRFTRPSRPLPKDNMIVDTHTLIIQVVFKNPQG